MRATIVLCDWAEGVNGKLYMQGGGWDKILANVPAAFGVAVIMRIEYNETNMRRHAVLSLVTEDGTAFPPTQPIVFEFDFEAGRPAGMRQGQVQTLTFAGKLGGVTFPTGGYRFEFNIEGHRQDDLPFEAVNHF